MNGSAMVCSRIFLRVLQQAGLPSVDANISLLFFGQNWVEHSCPLKGGHLWHNVIGTVFWDAINLAATPHRRPLASQIWSL